ncbi:MAG: hypothetical protein V4467_03850 [Patescibacteria group bacterium]
MIKIFTWAISSFILWATYFHLNALPEVQFELNQPVDRAHLTWSVVAVCVSLVFGVLITLGWPLYVFWDRAQDRLANAIARFIS